MNMDKMTAAQKNAYLEAHMAVQQHMQQATILFNKQHQQQQNIQRTDGQSNSNLSNQQSHQSPPILSSNQHYANTIKVFRLRWVNFTLISNFNCFCSRCLKLVHLALAGQIVLLLCPTTLAWAMRGASVFCKV